MFDLISCTKFDLLIKILRAYQISNPNIGDKRNLHLLMLHETRIKREGERDTDLVILLFILSLKLKH